ncbi:MAG TPA: class I SAM-dependent methyltransferase [Methanoregulaceae archaeon]|nr:class I SAM-dependent methyltransferase [Methanoregulaceae archaeon]
MFGYRHRRNCFTHHCIFTAFATKTRYTENVFVSAGNPLYRMDFFEEAYHGTPPWDIGRPQREFVRLEESGEISGVVLDAGCGTGENALFLAGRGHDVLGVDSAPAAIERARKKAVERGLAATFLVMDTLKLNEIGRTFDTVIDSGLFHTLSDSERPVFVRNLSLVLKPGGIYFMLAFSDREPGGYGPRRIAKKEIMDAFSDGWRINEIRDAVFESRTREEGSRAWLSSITRV